MRRSLIAIPALILAFTLSACTASGGGKRGDQAGGGSSKNSSAFKADPPLAFDAASAVKLPGTALRADLGGEVVSRFTTLRGRTAYIVEPTLLRSVDLLTGKQKWQLPIAGALAETIVVAVPVTDPGYGTTPSHQAISVLAANSETGRPKWATNVAENSSMVQATTLDLMKGEQRWVGAARSSQVTIVPANPALVVVDRADYGSGDADQLFLDPKTGQQKASYFKDRPFGMGSTLSPCPYDQRSVVVCPPFDAVTGKDSSAAPGAAPRWTSEYGGIGVDPQGAPIAYPARPSPSKTQ